MGNKVVKPYEEHVTLCYYPVGSTSKWVYSEPVTLLELDKPTSFSELLQGLKSVHYSIKPLKDRGFESYFIPNSELYDKKSLYNIQDDERLFKTFDTIDVSSENKLSKVSLIDATSRDASIDGVFLLEVPTFFPERDDIFAVDDPRTLRQKISDHMKIEVPQKYNKVLIYKVILPEDASVTKLIGTVINDSKLRDNINDNLGITIKDFDPEEYPFYFLHSSNDFVKILKSGKICPFGKCGVKFFDEDTGKYLYPKTLVSKYEADAAPGVYMEYLELNDFYMPPIGPDDVFRAKVLPTMSSIFGNIGFIFPLEEVFKYHVNVKREDSWGQGPDVSLSQYYVSSVGTEIVIRANSIDISTVTAVHLKFKAIELKFIYEHIPKVMGIRPKNITLQNVIDLYQEYRDTHWYIRKSNLLKVIDGYNSLDLPIPSLLCSREEYDYSDKIYNTIYDTDSESDEETLKD